MGGKITHTEHYTMPHGSCSEGKTDYWKSPKNTPFDNEYSHIGIFKYHESFDWIMPVLHEIQHKFHCNVCMISYNEKDDLLPYLINKTFVDKYYTILSGPYIRSLGVEEIKTKHSSNITSIYEAVLKFIELYNISKN